jgi:hypothetical protein
MRKLHRGEWTIATQPGEDDHVPVADDAIFTEAALNEGVLIIEDEGIRMHNHSLRTGEVVIDTGEELLECV